MRVGASAVWPGVLAYRWLVGEVMAAGGLSTWGKEPGQQP